MSGPMAASNQGDSVQASATLHSQDGGGRGGAAQLQPNTGTLCGDKQRGEGGNKKRSRAAVMSEGSAGFFHSLPRLWKTKFRLCLNRFFFFFLLSLVAVV